jgi:hypothetical protein
VMLEAQIQHLDRGFQAQVCEQVNDAAAACQVAAQVVAEVSRLAASMLIGDGFPLPNTTYQNAAAPSKCTKQVLVSKDTKLSCSLDLSSSQQDPATNGFPLHNTTYQNTAAPSKCTKKVLVSKDMELSCSLDLSSSQQDPATNGFPLHNTTYQNAAAPSKRTKQVLVSKDTELSCSLDLSSSQQDPATNGFPLPNTTYQNAAPPSKCTKPVLLSKDMELSCSLDLSSSQQDPATNAGLENRGVQDFMIVPTVKDDDMASDASWVKEVDGDTESESSWKDTVLPRSASNTGLDGVRMTLPSGNHTKGISMLSVGAQQTYDYLSKLVRIC